MFCHIRWPVLLLVFVLGGVGGVARQGQASQRVSAQSPDPATATGWFRRADDLTNIRMPGSAPFHMKVIFHALPGVDFAKPGKSDIITGDGVYEEWWASPEKWRREVTLAGYHAVEVRANGVRKMQASSDYEPSRVLMLLDALLSPVPRNLLEPRLEKDPPDWTVKHLNASGLSYVRLSNQWVWTNGKTYFSGYNFLPSGVLIRADDVTSMMTTWQSFTPFAGKIVPGQIAVQAMGRDLLTATVHIEPLPATDEIAQVPGPPASPGTTLRPFHDWEVRVGVREQEGPEIGNLGRYAFRVVVDRDGRLREPELLATDDVNFAKDTLIHLRALRYWPPTIDRSPCEIESKVYY